MSAIRPKLPASFYKLDGSKAFAFFAYAIALWMVPVAAIHQILVAGWPLYFSVPATLVIALIGGYGILLAGFVGHDGTHFALHKNKIVSVALGILATAPLVILVEMGFALSHWRHHQFVGEENDPDVKIFGRFKNFWSRAILARPAASNTYALNALNYLLGRRPDFKFPLPESDLKRLTLFNFLACGFFLAIHILIAMHAPLLTAAFLIVLGAGSVVSGLSPYVEHAGTHADRGYETRTSTGLWWDVFLYGNNYHIEHHLYPNLPVYRLKDAHKFLVNAGYYDARRPLTHGLLNNYRQVLGDSCYAPVKLSG